MMIILKTDEKEDIKSLKALDCFLDKNHQLFGMALGKHSSAGYILDLTMCLEFLTQTEVN